MPAANRILTKWTAPARPFKKRSRDFYVTLISIASLFGLVLFIVEGSIVPVFLIVSAVFLIYVMSTVEPEKVEHQVTQAGLMIAGKFFEWDMMNRFWFVNRFGSEVLVIEIDAMPGRLELVVEANDREKVRKEMLKHIPYEQAPASFLDKTAHWASKKLPNN